MIFHATTFTQPYAELTACGHKLIDNRTWLPSAKYMKQRLAVHASLKLDEKDEYGLLAKNPRFPLMPAATYAYGAIIGSVRLVGWGKRHKEEWRLTGEFSDAQWDEFLSSTWLADGTKCFWVFDQPEVFKPIPCVGSLQIWKIPKDVLSEVQARSQYKGGMEVISETEVTELEEDFMPEIKWKKRIDPHYCAVQGCGRSVHGFKATGDRYYPVCKPDGEGEKLTSLATVLERAGHSVDGVVALLQLTQAEAKKLLEMAQRNGVGPAAGNVVATPGTLTDAPGNFTPSGSTGSTLVVEGGTAGPAVTPPPAPGANVSPSELVPADDPSLERATAVAIIPAAELKALHAEAMAAWEQVEGFFVVNQQGMDLAKHVATQARAQRKALDERRKQIVVPLNMAKDKVQDAFNPVLKLLDQIVDHLKARMVEGVKAIEGVQDIALANTEAAFRAGDAEGAALAAQMAQGSTVDLPAGMHTRTVVEYEVYDLNQVPREFFELSDQKVKHALKAGLIIPGIRAVEKQSAVLRG